MLQISIIIVPCQLRDVSLGGVLGELLSVVTKGDLKLTDVFSGRAHTLMTELLQMGKWTDWNANFHPMINLQYEIVGTELSPRGCALLLYSISQLLPAITVNPHCPPHTKPLLHYIYQALYKRWKHMTAALRAVFPPGLGGLRWGKGDLQLAHSASVHRAGRQWHHEGHFFHQALTHPPIDSTF